MSSNYTVEPAIKGSGIIPFTYYNNQLYFLLGYQHGQKKNKWIDLGGKRNSDENPLEAAIREFWEESLDCVFNSYQDLDIWFRCYMKYYIDIDSYRSYFIYIPPQSINKKKFTSHFEQQKITYTKNPYLLEIQQLKWVSLRTFNHISQFYKTSKIQNQYHRRLLKVIQNFIKLYV